MNTIKQRNLFQESELLPISALQHIQFCERQCALIHIERIWAENRLTVEGHLLHEKVHDAGDETRPGITIARGLSIRSCKLGLIGKADAVEFHKQANGAQQPYPIEYKRGKPKIDDCDLVQLCAQALCLEEMLNITIPQGAIYYGKTHRRLEVVFSEALRQETESAARQLHALMKKGTTPTAVKTLKCEKCSLVEYCLPDTAGGNKSAIEYVKEISK
ncbi:MAG: CRISPR-associated protein Cas4 [Candidatus Raymondbacteria bacterium RifOxyC12_full_50_8]|uniref:CRISPR-associated exonuclease Cas4 n=1 Tax=Candidatus Raymondbacteria bacterium RIFOXYD12_FULL_49_13 TaxID=1817890 RepID=A0A1F7F9F0_UNCRA|nr:MAG: CRISPR-associated protein Cas4 [Candidatus Raymondbacteria bacterium RifOxyB12_full_50_8]OGJ93221.1 MAG: CRISPR-associated protein Cas4 [Candidatus Raymondbacteria bacterium RIFOXYA2_FULL_49_16]OGK03304.1 MAG: CRISPR-associated protein Cas4 [Candidatus Raymondbacteria bacterium RIFOXYD12_FULL_49_13]OGK07423.1 MAG: CRISPR-associated protein Cas4 [Candidatus Raymondbacteria bacterium RifOxyC12_full_50_8]OGP44943.1 MAG: CRISPR-associated protein Cas4 [Candidatus Raymondbacteria bacterium R